MADVTGGESGAVKTAPESGAAKTTTPESGANGSASFEARIAELTGEKKRKDEVIAGLRTELDGLKEKLKTDDEKRIEQLAAERFAPQLAEGKAAQEFLAKELEGLMAQIPDEQKAMVQTGATTLSQITLARGVLSLLKVSTPPAFSGGGNPGTEAKRSFSKAEYDKWANSVYTDRAYYDANRIEMQAAVMDGRVEGVKR